METMKLTPKQNLLKSVDVAGKIKLTGSFQQSMKQLDKYPVLVQYIKLSDMMYDWFDSVYSNTKDPEFITMKNGFTTDTINNFDVYVQTDNIKGIGEMLKVLKHSMSKIFVK
jgi:hypothetical protein